MQSASRNIIPIGFFLGGEELHNNHHAFATSAKFSNKWWEFDSGWLVVRLLQIFKLATPKRVAQKPKRLLNKTNIDLDTIRAIISYRLQVMSSYTREVVLPALREERKHAGKTSRALFRRAKTVLTRDSSLMKASQKNRLDDLLETFHSLRVVYQFRVKLQDIWSRSTANQKELIDALQEWCQQAEATGLEALRRFSMSLKTYVPQS